MNTETPTFWLLNGSLGWRCQRSDGLASSESAGIRLAADPEGPLAMSAEDGSLGGLVLPKGMAWDQQGKLYLASNNRIKRFEAKKREFETLPAIGGAGGNAREFSADANIAIADNDLFIVDPCNQRVQVFSLRTLALRYVWGPGMPMGSHRCYIECETWHPQDIAAEQHRVLILDAEAGKVYLHCTGVDKLEVLIKDTEYAGQWSRIAIDKQQRIYLLNSSKHQMQVYDGSGHYLGVVNDSGEVIDRFDPTGIRLDHKNRFCLSADLIRHCAGDPTKTPRPASPLLACRFDNGGLLFNRDGTAATLPDDPEQAGPLLYQQSGLWISEPLDSRIFNCQWHRIESQIADLPAGTKMLVKTYTDDSIRSIEDIENLPDTLWQEQSMLLGKLQGTQTTQLSESRYSDALIQSHEGQYIWIKLELSGDGYGTPVVHDMKIHFPRDSYLKYLPAVFSADDESRRFLERYLSLFQSVWDDFEEKIDNIAILFDPATVPGGAFLTYLSQWLALPLEGDWNDEQKRRLLEAAPAVYEKRGTPKALRQFLQTYLENITGLESDMQASFPILVEGFRKRDYLAVSNAEHGRLNRDHKLWSRSVVSRMELDSFSTAGEVRLVSTGDPERDLFHAHAHRFQVFIPANWIKTRDDEEMITRALDSEKPAHTDYDLCLVEPRMRVGVQSTIGVDTIIGDYPQAVLGNISDDSAPINQAPRHRLGYDTILSARSKRRGGIPLHPNVNMGMNTILS